MLMEMGVEIYKLKHEVNTLRDFRQSSQIAIRCIRSILEERGYVNDEEFTLAMDVAQFDESKANADNPQQAGTFPRKLAN